MTFERPLTGAELVLVAQVPGAGNRWHQVHLNAALVEQFFRLGEGHQTVRMQRVDERGRVSDPVTRSLVFSRTNKNYKIEFDFGDVKDYPVAGPPLLLILEVDVRAYRYQLLLPGERGYEEMNTLNVLLPSVGRGFRRVISNLDEVELRWPGCRLRPTMSLLEAGKALRAYQDEGKKAWEPTDAEVPPDVE